MVVCVVLLVGTGSAVAEVTVAEFWMVVPAAVPLMTLSVRTIAGAALPLFSANVYVQTIGPALLFPGLVQFQLVPVIALKTVLGGVCW